MKRVSKISVQIIGACFTLILVAYLVNVPFIELTGAQFNLGSSSESGSIGKDPLASVQNSEDGYGHDRMDAKQKHESTFALRDTSTEKILRKREGNPADLAMWQLPNCTTSYNHRFCRLKAILQGNHSVLKQIEQQSRTGHFLSACTAVKDAGDLLHEFIIRNYLAGIDHFFIYDDSDNKSMDNVSDVLRQLSSLVTIQQVPEKQTFLSLINRTEHNLRAFKNPQHVMYWHCFLEHGRKSRWLIPIDTDEFVEAKNPSELEENGLAFEDVPFMHTFLKRIQDTVPAQVARWETVMTNNLGLPPPLSKRTLSERFPVTCGRKDEFADPSEPGFLFSGKSAVQPRYLDLDYYKKEGIFFVHGVKHWVGDVKRAKELYFTKPYVDYSVPVNTTDTPWTLVHYWSRSFADYLVKRDRGRADGQRKRSIEDVLDREILCRKNKQMGLSESTSRREKMVGHLLGDVEAFSELQEIYYNITLRTARSEKNAEAMRQYENFLKGRGERPR